MSAHMIFLIVKTMIVMITETSQNHPKNAPDVALR